VILRASSGHFTPVLAGEKYNYYSARRCKKAETPSKQSNHLTSNFLILDFMQRLLKVTNRLKQLQRFEGRSVIPIVILRQFFQQTLDIDQNKEIDDDHYHVNRTRLRL
jgi:hypothetical protein